jgi:hypothetical protein
LLKIQRLKDFNGNGYLQGVRHAAPYGNHSSIASLSFLDYKKSIITRYDMI